MKLSTINRQGDKWPILSIEAENEEEGIQLHKLLKDFEVVQKIGIEYGSATGGIPPCGNGTHHYACDALSIRIILGQGTMRFPQAQRYICPKSERCVTGVGVSRCPHSIAHIRSENCVGRDESPCTYGSVSCVPVTGIENE